MFIRLELRKLYTRIAFTCLLMGSFLPVFGQSDSLPTKEFIDRVNPFRGKNSLKILQDSVNLLEELYNSGRLSDFKREIQGPYWTNLNQKLRKGQSFFLIQEFNNRYMRTGDERAEISRAKKLMTLAHLYDQEWGLAEDDFKDLLNSNPTYEVDFNSDPPILFDQFRKIRKWPNITFYLQAGVNLTKPQLFTKHPFGLDNTQNRKLEYTSGFEYVGLDFGLGFNKPLFNFLQLFTLKNPETSYVSDWDFAFDGLISYREFKYSHTLGTSSLADAPEGFSDFATTEFTESHWGLTLSPSLVRNFNDIRLFNNFQEPSNRRPLLVPFARLGAFSYYIWRPELSEVTRVNTFGESVKEPFISIANIRNNWNYGFVGGLGINFRSGGNYFGIEGRYHFILNNLAESDKRYSNDDLIYKFGYIDNDFRINAFSILLQYKFANYSPTPIKFNP